MVLSQSVDPSEPGPKWLTAERENDTQADSFSGCNLYIDAHATVSFAATVQHPTLSNSISPPSFPLFHAFAASLAQPDPPGPNQDGNGTSKVLL